MKRTEGIMAVVPTKSSKCIILPASGTRNDQ